MSICTWCWMRSFVHTHTLCFVQPIRVNNRIGMIIFLMNSIGYDLFENCFKLLVFLTFLRCERYVLASHQLLFKV